MLHQFFLSKSLKLTFTIFLGIIYYKNIIRRIILLEANKKYIYNEETGESTFTIRYKGYDFVGEAMCHPDDWDSMSWRTGLTVAEARANIKLLKFKRNTEIKPALKALTDLWNCSNHKNREKNKALRVSLQKLNDDLIAINNDIAGEEDFLKSYLKEKDDFSRKVKLLRADINNP